MAASVMASRLATDLGLVDFRSPTIVHPPSLRDCIPFVVHGKGLTESHMIRETRSPGNEATTEMQRTLRRGLPFPGDVFRGLSAGPRSRRGAPGWSKGRCPRARAVRPRTW